MEETFKVLTFNCWGVFIPFCTVRKNDRLALLIKRLSEGDYDILLLQEIWTDSDFKLLQTSLKNVYSYANYFHSNLIGSGLCIFSKWPIDTIFMHPYGANGYPHYLHQADWYCGKGIGLARVISRKGFIINLYVTHLIARYALDRSRDTYDSHRISQLLELMEFIRMTASSADGIIITGDFNLESDTTAIKLFRTYLGVSDAWLNNLSVVKGANVKDLELEGCTCDRADNPYRNDEWAKFYGNGERLDYIFYRTGSGPTEPSLRPNCTMLTCHSCWLDLRKVPDEPTGLHYSDHEAVGAQFTLNRVPTDKPIAEPAPLCAADVDPMMLEISQQIERGFHQCSQARLFHFLCGVLVSLVLVLLLMNSANYSGLGMFFVILSTGTLSAVLFMLFWGALVGHTAERRSLENAKLTIRLMISNLRSGQTGVLSKNGGDDGYALIPEYGDNM
ncbi:sphingomyelin phosphodiesterase 2 [Paragonimus westermani]|uniref:sphingomyelin phosphodiesterase n=1 Tax=Paragonimus westermani TaxID=34504 RepID=A0A5J4NI54_9TREM|nr:sphingomyelin phosphodiesterase 2 [Paragonimus westermani]